MPAPSPRRGFTLIELILSIALGIVLVYTAIAGVRVASQAVTVSARLSTENALMRAGIARAHDEVDFWTTYDDPEQADAQRPLKRPGGWSGLSFQPFAATFAGGGTGTGEDALGWDGSAAAWSVANPRTWIRGNLVEKDNSDLRFGRYAIFANTKDTLQQSEMLAVPAAPPPVTTPPTPPGPPIPYGPVSPPHHWCFRQIAGLDHALGYFGMLEYLPASFLYEFYGATGAGAPNDWNNYVYDDSKTNAGGIPQWCIHPDGWGFNNWDGGQQTARGKYRNTYATSYALVDPLSPLINSDQNALTLEARRWWSLGYGADAGQQDDFNRKTAVSYQLMPIRPAAWPDLRVSVQRFIKNARHATICRVAWTSPITGDNAELSFASFGSSLRGARQQRHPVTGWARWDDDADHSADPAYKTLDSY